MPWFRRLLFPVFPANNVQAVEGPIAVKHGGLPGFDDEVNDDLWVVRWDPTFEATGSEPATSCSQSERATGAVTRPLLADAQSFHRIRDMCPNAQVSALTVSREAFRPSRTQVLAIETASLSVVSVRHRDRIEG